MGLFNLVKRQAKWLKIWVFVSVAVFDITLAVLIYEPKNVVHVFKTITEKIASIKAVNPTKTMKEEASPTSVTQPESSDVPALKANTSSSPSPSAVASPKAENKDSDASATPKPADNTPFPSSVTTPAPSAATPTPSPVSTESPTPNPVPASPATTSQVQITGYVYAGNQQLTAEFYPVAVKNSNGETIHSGETGQDGKSQVWQIPANTTVKIYLYPKAGFGGCGDVWELTTGDKGTFESHNLSIQGDRNPCITQ